MWKMTLLGLLLRKKRIWLLMRYRILIGQVLQCLTPRAWLNDYVINLYLELLKEREKRELKRFRNAISTTHFSTGRCEGTKLLGQWQLSVVGILFLASAFTATFQSVFPVVVADSGLSLIGRRL